VAQFRYRKRTFLSPVSNGTTSYIRAEIESSEDGTYRLGNYILTLADCRRIVELEFPLTTPRVLQQSLAKIDLLAEVIDAFRDALHEEAGLIEKAR
jgi:hypothetical protein